METNFMYMYRKGFTLVETLVAISVLLLVIVGPMTVAQKGIQNARYAQQQLTAVFLAQEAIESVREERDNFALDVYHNGSGTTWGWIDSPVVSGCIIEGTYTTGCGLGSDGNFTRCSINEGSNSSCKITLGTDGKYGASTYGSETPFTRTIKIVKISSGVASVTVDVTWNSTVFENSARTISLKSWIYDHYQRYE